MKYDEKLVKHLRSKRYKKERVMGRYNSSEIFGIMKGYITPEEWIKGQEPDDDGVWRMFIGTITDAISKEAMEAEGFDCHADKIKKVLKVNDEITIVCLPDAVKGDVLHEFKTLTFNMKGEPKLVADQRNPHHAHRIQVECYLRGFDLQEGFISYLQLFPRDSVTFVYRRDDKLWEKIKQDLIHFHGAVKMYSSY